MTLEANDFPDNWKDNPAPDSTAELGDEWLQIQASLALELPSTIVPREKIYLISIRHPAFENALITVQEMDFEFDQQLR